MMPKAAWLSIFMLTVAVGMIAIPARGDTVERRGMAPALQGRVLTTDDAGVRIETESGATLFVPWDRVRDVKLDKPDPLLSEYLRRAADIWRARTRLERNDLELAEPLFERLFEHYRGQTHETALVVAEGLLRCRLARGANDLAVIPALEVTRLYRAGISTTSYATLPPVFDASSSLCPALAPVWVTATPLVRIERELAAYESLADATVASLASLYRRAMRQQLGMAVEPERAVQAADHGGVMLLRAIVETTSPDAQQRAAARNRLEHDLPKLPPWAQAWAHYFIGVSLLEEPSEQSQQRGMVSLVHLPARFSSEQPFLVGLALARLSSAFEAAGDSEAASKLRAELQRLYPHHAVLVQAGNRVSSHAIKGNP